MAKTRKRSLPDDPHLDPTRPLTFPKSYELFEALISLRVRVGVLADAAKSVHLHLSSARIPRELTSYQPPADGVPIDDFAARCREMGIPQQYRFWVRSLDSYSRELARLRHELAATRRSAHVAANEIDSADASATDRLTVRISATLSRLGGVIGTVEQAESPIRELKPVQYSERIRGFRAPLQEWINALRPIAYHQSSSGKRAAKAHRASGAGRLSVPQYAELKRQFAAASAKWKDLRCVGTICATEEPALKGETTVHGLRVLVGTKLHEIVSEYVTSARDHFSEATGRPAATVIKKPRVQWVFYGPRLAREDRQAAMARFKDLSAAAWRVSPSRVTNGACMLPWLDPRAATDPVVAWTALLHTLVWMRPDESGYEAPRWVVREGGARKFIDSYFRRSMLGGTCVQDSYDSALDRDDLLHLESEGVTWPPRVFETAIGVDVFLGSVLAIDLIARSFNIEGTEGGTPRMPSAAWWTKKELAEAARVSDGTLTRIIKKTRLARRKRGEHGAKFSLADVEEICIAARKGAAGKRTWKLAAENLEKLLEPDFANE